MPPPIHQFEPARIYNESRPGTTPVDVLFNPTEFTIERGVNYVTTNRLARDKPILQFNRGELDVLTVELFLDRTATRGGTHGGNVESALAQLRTYVTVDAELHAPPVISLRWGGAGNGPRIKGVVSSLRERALLFDQQGNIIRARVNLTIKSFEGDQVGRRRQRRQSPDRTRVRVLREGETLSHIAHEAYNDPRSWRVIAEANDIDRPRFVDPGTPLAIPSYRR